MNTNFNNVFDWNTRDGGLCACMQVDPLPSDPDCLFRSFETAKLMHFMWLRRKATNHKMSSDEPSEELRNYSGHVNSHFSAVLVEFIVAFCWWCGGQTGRQKTSLNFQLQSHYTCGQFLMHT